MGSVRLRRRAAALAACSAMLLSIGCAAKMVTIKTLLDDPSRFDGKKVKIAGDVQGSMGALGVGTYEMSDGTGTLRVVSQSGGAPRQGAHVGVEGTFESAFTMGSQSLAVIVEKNRFTP